MLAIVSSFKEWRRYQEGIEPSILVFSDHMNLEYFTIIIVLTYCQARWAPEFAGNDPKIVFCPGNLNGMTDTRSRHAEYSLSREISVKTVFN
jgi:hypothetical protein